MDPLGFDGRGARRKKNVAAESDRAVGEGGVMGLNREMRGECGDGVRVIGMWASEVGKQVRSRN